MRIKISIGAIYRESIVDGIGVRTSIYAMGCSHQCYNCHNPQTWDINNGTLLTVQDIYDRVAYYSVLAETIIPTGITFTGGDPMYQAAGFSELARLIKYDTKFDIWCYTGYTFEEIINSQDDKYNLLKNVDVLVDGRYIHELRDISLDYRGSSNQRIIDVQESLKQNTIIQITDFRIRPKNKNKPA